LKFQREISDAKFSTEFAEAVLESSASSSAESSNSGDCPTQPLWEGFLVTGNMAAIAAAIADGETIEFDVALWQVEPSLVQNLRETFVRTVNLANHDRLHVTPGESCSSQSSLSSDEIFVDTRCLTGDLRLREGFNCSIRQENATRTLTIGAAVGAGSGLPCEEIPLYAGEDAPGGDPVLSGGPDCLSVLKTINGVGGTILQLTPGDGVRIFPHETSPNKLVVDVDLHDFAICALPDEGESSLSI